MVGSFCSFAFHALHGRSWMSLSGVAGGMNRESSIMVAFETCSLLEAYLCRHRAVLCISGSGCSDAPTESLDPVKSSLQEHAKAKGL